MARVKRGFKARRRRNRLLRHARGFRNARSRAYRIAQPAVQKAWLYAYKHRRERKRNYRALWITRINAASRANGMTYSKLMHGLKKSEVQLDRRVLADIAVHDPEGFGAVVSVARASLK